jgi:lactoylglutathione lyase
MNLGAFSISLAVKDLTLSKEFYEKLGFKEFAGDAAQNWLIMKNGDHLIGLFQDIIEKNTLTFNPRWNQNAESVEGAPDVRDIQQRLKEQGVEFVAEANESTDGPANFIIMDPDGNPILVDQHV